MRITVHVRPNSRCDEVAGVYAGAILVRVRAVAEDGKANDAVRSVVARHLGVPQREVSVLRGRTARRKVLEVPDDARVAGLVAGLIGNPPPSEQAE